MILSLLFSNPVDGVIFLIAIALAIGVHEAAHAWSADKLGDNTAKLMGRASINPLVHLDPIGTLLFLIAGFGWGKPVPVNESRLRHNRDIILVAMAGPASNFLVAVVLALLFRLIPSPDVQHVLATFIFINLSLMVFNLIPIPPLDGSKILRLFVTNTFYYMIEQYGFILILLLLLFLRIGNSGFAGWLVAIVQNLFTILTGAHVSL